MAYYITPAETQRALGLVCTGYGYSAHKVSPCLPRDLGCYAAVWISQGSGWLETAATRQTIPISSGTLFWLFPGVVHSYSPDQPGWNEQWVLFEGKLAENFEQAGLFSRNIPARKVTTASVVAGLFGQIREDFTRTNPQTAILSGMLVGRLIAEVNSPGNFQAEEGSSLTVLIQQTIDWLAVNWGEEIDFEKLARVKGIGYSTFRRYFKQATGLPPREYLQNLRISRAKELLVFTGDTIKQIALTTGFRDPYYFSRVFHAEVGLSPTEFRQQQQLWSTGGAFPAQPL